MFYDFFKMKKKFLKGEISTIITLGTLIVLGVSSLVSTVFFKKTQTIKTKATGCSQVSSVSYSGNVVAGQTFTCLASTDGASPYTMACGISKNGGWPYGMRSGSCSGTRCTFSVKMDNQIEAGAVYELVAFDFRTECGPNTGKKITLNISGAQPQPTQANCDQECCGRPDGFIYQRAIKERCDSNYKGGRYVIIDGVCQGGKKTEKPGCATCKTCQAGAPDISPVPGADLAVNECTSSCEQSGGGICSNLPNCPANITPAIVRSCSDTSFSCTLGYTACKKDRAIWCYGSGMSGGVGNPTPTAIPSPTNIPPSTNPPPRGENPPPTGIIPRGGEGQLCKIGYEHGEKYYYCDGNLVCTKQSTDGICVTSSPTNIPPSTNPPPRGENPPLDGITAMGGEGQLCRIGSIGFGNTRITYYYCDKNLVCSQQSPNGICVNPNSTNTPTPIETLTPTTPNTAGITPRGGEGQLCKIGYEHGEKYYYCDGNLVCTKQSTDGICVTSTSIPTTTPNNTMILTPKSQPICYPYGPNLTNCVTPTPTPTGTCVNYGVNPPEANLSCPYTYSEDCQIFKPYLQKGTRYVKRDCGQGNDSCHFSCKKIEDLGNNNYSGNCSKDDTCLVSNLSEIPVKVKITVNNPTKKWLDTVGIVDENGKLLASTRLGCGLFGCTRIDYSPLIELTIDIPRYYPPNYEFSIKPFVVYTEKQKGKKISIIEGSPYLIKTLHISSSSQIKLQIDLQHVN